MVTTGTYAFNPAASDIVLNAYALVGQRATMLTVEHFERAAFQAQMLGVDFTNRNPNRWQMEEVPIVLQAGVPTYQLPPETVAVSAVWIDRTPGPISRVLGPLSAVDYASIAAKFQQGTPNSYFFNLLTPIPTITFWLVPNQNPAFTARVQTFKQQQDTSLKNDATVDTPYRFLDALTWGLASRLAVLYPDQSRPTLPVDLKAQYLESFRLAAQLDQERVPLRLGPILSGYYPMG